MSKYDILIIVGFILVFTGVMVFGIHYTWQDKPIQINPIVADDIPYSSMRDNFVYGESQNTTKLNLDCIRMFYSDEWNKGYITSLAEFCSNVGAPK